MIDGCYHNYENYNFLDCVVGQFVFGQFNKYKYLSVAEASVA